VDAERSARTRATLETVKRGIESVALVRGRKSLVLLSSGFLDESGLSLMDVSAEARAANVAIYFMDVRGLIALTTGFSASDASGEGLVGGGAGTVFEETVLASAGTQRLAEDTGGLSLRNTNDLAGAGDRIVAESRVFYMLGVVPPAGKAPGAWRSLRVQVNRRGLTVRARRGYALRPAVEAESARGRGRRPLAPATESTLASTRAVIGIPLRAIVYVLDPAGKDGTRVLVAAEFDADALGLSETGAARLEVTLAATLRDTGKTLYSDERVEVRAPKGGPAGWRSVARDLILPQGVALARLVVRDPVSGKAGAVSQRIEIPAPGVFRTSTPILTDQVVRPTGVDAKPQAAVAAHRTFRAEGALYCAFDVFGAARSRDDGLPHVTSSVEVRAADGTIVREAAASPIAADRNGRVVRLIGLALQGIPEGAYELRLAVRDEVSGAEVQRTEPFVIGQ
jgi:hypothetical protein